MRRRLLGLILIAALAPGVTAAVAHAILERTEPRANATLRGAPAQVRLWFSGALEPAYSRVEVVDERGRRVDAGDASVAPGSRTLLRASLPPLPAGRYRVAWRVLAVDGHLTEGSYTFRVAP